MAFTNMRKRLLEAMVLEILQAKWKYDGVDGAGNCKFCVTSSKLAEFVFDVSVARADDRSFVGHMA